MHTLVQGGGRAELYADFDAQPYSDDIAFYGDGDELSKPVRGLADSTAGEYNLLSWSHKHPLNWSPVEVLDWLFYVASQEKYQIDFRHFRAEAFRDKTGFDLSRMRHDEFVSLMPEYGALYCSLFQNLLQHGTFEYEPVADELGAPDLTDISNSHCLFNPQEVDMSDESMLGAAYPAGIPFPAMFDFGSASPLSGLASGSYPDSDESSSCDYKPQPRLLAASGSSSETFSHSDSDIDEAAPAGKSRRPSQTKGNHLWEFVRDLLRNEEHNPYRIKWENKADGVFRFVHSEAVAKMWGQKKNNPSMTYEKLSRAMRFCRKAGYFDAVPKSGQFPKKLVFKFGPLCWANGDFKD